MSGEFDFIQWLRTQQVPSDLIRVGIGDDLAVLNWKAADLLVVGVDQVLDGVHFNSERHSPRLIGRKVMNRNLSDCAAMAALPAAALASVALPHSADLQYAKELYLGLRDAADPFDCVIIGGETGSWPGPLALTVTILARSAGIDPVTRSGAQPGDGIYVTGPLGGSLLGRHMTFTPRVHLGRQLGEWGVTSMIDLSDGISRDLGHICDRSNCGAIIKADAIPIHDDAIRIRRDGTTPLEHALHDGEDYELLFTRAIAAVPVELPKLHLIGQMVAEPGVWLDVDGTREPLEQRGWEHRL